MEAGEGGVAVAVMPVCSQSQNMIEIQGVLIAQVLPAEGRALGHGVADAAKARLTDGREGEEVAHAATAA
ncbi:hypothetical protein AEAC466_19290 [Asticcacaulis sp. AC466]|nr:hypothetical protein AEAC466_19290 [Asticcacaulis sp. AC466]